MTSQAEQTPLEAPVEPDLGRWKVKRNLHYWIMGIVVVILAVFMVGDAFRSENPSDELLSEQRQQKEKQNASLNKTDQAPAREDLDHVLARQQKEAEERLSAVPQSAQLPGPLTTQLPLPGPLPPLPQGTPRPSAGLPEPSQGQNQEAMSQAKREEQILASPIMAIENGSRLAAAAARNSRASGASADPVEDRERRMADARVDRDQMFNKALSASTSLMGGGPRGAGGRQAAAPDTFYEDMVDERNSQNVLRPVPTRGAYSLLEGSTIPAVLISEVRSDLPGDLKAQTTMDVYDSVNGSALLIPKGSILVGKYNSEVRPGQEKVMAGFTRLIYPSGASIDLGGMKAAEGTGESGLADDVNNHFWKMFGTNLLIAGLAQIFQKDQGNVTVVGGQGADNAMSNTAGTILSDTVKVINERNRVIPPTIYVYRGHKFNVMVNKDMVLPPAITGVRQ